MQGKIVSSPNNLVFISSVTNKFWHVSFWNKTYFRLTKTDIAVDMDVFPSGIPYKLLTDIFHE